MGLFSAVLGGITSLAQQTGQNTFNMQEAKKNREWQERMYEKQKQDNIEMWNMQNAYNDPSAQVARLEAAGINPTMALQNISTGSASSAAQSAQAGSGAQATGIAPSMADAVGAASNILNAGYQRRMMKEQADNVAADSMLKRINAMTEHDKNLAEIVERLAGKDSKLADAFLKRSLGRTENYMRHIRANQVQTEINESVTRQISTMAHLKYLPMDKRLEYSEKMANIATMKQNNAESRQRVRKLIQETNHEYFKAQGQKFLNDLDRKTEHWLIREREHKSRMSSPFEFGDIVNDWFKGLW